jgi:Phosphoesterase family
MQNALQCLLVLTCLALGTVARADGAGFPRYDHIFLIIEENHGYNDIIGNKFAPNINRLAREYGLATQFFSTADPSAPNYVAMLGGSDFGIADDNGYYLHTVDAPSLTTQLDGAGLAWRAYLQGYPYPGYRGMCYPGRCNGVPDFDPLYSSKHNGIVYFRPFQQSKNGWASLLPVGRLDDDLAHNPPNFGYIIPDQCHDMHGSPPWCGDSGNVGNPGDLNDSQLVARGDAYVGELVGKITRAPFWISGNNAIVITFDEGDDNAGCCGVPGTGQIVTIVVTSHGPRRLQDPTPYNHYSLLRSLQLAFGLGCLKHSCDAATMPMAPLFAIAK